jgi:hypothetical protein
MRMNRICTIGALADLEMFEEDDLPQGELLPGMTYQEIDRHNATQPDRTD